MSKNIHLTIVDPQNDFCSPNGSLFVPGADQDMARLATMINKYGDKISDIHVTLDSHRVVDIAHSITHINSNGEHPAPFTIISVSDYENGTWRCTNPAWQNRILDYLRQLETGGRYPLCVWPNHCVIAATRKLNDGSEFCGHAVVLPVSEALSKWENDNFAIVDYISKGSNVLVECYSCVKAEVPDPGDPSTMLNTGFIETLQNADEVIVAGEALSHCVANSIRDICESFGPEHIKKIVLLTDCSSNVPGFENLGTDFVRDMTARGMQISTSVDYFA